MKKLPIKNHSESDKALKVEINWIISEIYKLGYTFHQITNDSNPQLTPSYQGWTVQHVCRPP